MKSFRYKYIIICFALLANYRYGHCNINIDSIAETFRSIEYKVTPFCEINYSAKGAKVASDEGGLYYGPTSFYVDSNRFIYIPDCYDNTLYVFNSKGVFVNKNIIKKGLIDFTILENKIYVFNGEKIDVYNKKSIKLIQNLRIPEIKGLLLITNMTFFYKSYLFICATNNDSLNSDFLYIYDVRTKTLSNIIESDNMFLPFTNCRKSDFAFLIDLFFNDSSRTIFLGQSERLILGCLSIKGEYGPIDKYFIFDKVNGECRILKDFYYRVNLISGLKFNFIKDNEAIFQEMDMEGIKYVKLIYRKIQINIDVNSN